MVLRRFRRRTFLGGFSAAVAGIAGCAGTDGSDGPSSSVESPSESRSGQSGVPPHDHSGEGQGGATLAPHELSVTANQRAYSYVIYERDGETRALDCETETEAFGDEDATGVIQRAIRELDAGTILVKRGEYRIGRGGLSLESNVRLVGEGRGATTLKLEDGIDGRRGDGGSSVLHIGENVSDVTIADLEIDGNESNNRGVPPYPMSPHHHGILVHGSGPQVPEERKPANVVVRNVSVHDTVRSNVVLAGRNCELENLWLSNSASDHWLYMGGATNCTVRGVHASGFARAEGIVLGVGRRRCSGNTITDVKISGIAETPYQNDEPSGLGGRYPVRSVIFRPSSGNAYDNTLRNVDISLPDAPVGCSIAVGQPNTRIQNLNYRGPAAHGEIVHTGSGPDAHVQNASITLDGTNPDSKEPHVDPSSSGTTLKDVTIIDEGDRARPAVRLVEPDALLDRVTLRDVSVASRGPALDVRTGGRIRNLYVENFHDRNDAGVTVSGDVEFSNRDVH